MSNLPHETHPTRDNLEARIRKLEEQNRVMTSALRWMADPNNWRCDGGEPIVRRATNSSAQDGIVLFSLGLKAWLFAQTELAFAGVHRFDKVSCSQCGGEFGARNHGYSHCEDHTKARNEK